MGTLHDLLFEYETTPDGGEGGGGDAPAPPAEPESPSAEPAPDAPEDAPQYVTPDALAEALAPFQGLAQLAQTVEAAQYQPEQGYQEPDLPEFDPYDPESFAAYLEARDQRLIGQLQQVVAPITDDYQNRYAEQWAEQTFSALDIPDDPQYREAVLRASTSFTHDQFGRQLPPHEAIRQGHEFLGRLAESFRTSERERLAAEANQTTEQLRNIAQAPNTPSGNGGGVEGQADVTDLRSVARAALERINAASVA